MFCSLSAKPCEMHTNNMLCIWQGKGWWATGDAGCDRQVRQVGGIPDPPPQRGTQNPALPQLANWPLNSHAEGLLSRLIAAVDLTIVTWSTDGQAHLPRRPC